MNTGVDGLAKPSGRPQGVTGQPAVAERASAAFGNNGEEFIRFMACILRGGSTA